MPLLLTISSCSKSRLVLLSWFYLSGAGSPGLSQTKSKRTIKRLCVYVCVVCPVKTLDIENSESELVHDIDGVTSDQGDGWSLPCTNAFWRRNEVCYLKLPGVLFVQWRLPMWKTRSLTLCVMWTIVTSAACCSGKGRNEVSCIQLPALWLCVQ